MANWWNNTKRVDHSKNGRRFLTSFDMSEAKRIDAILKKY